jgi:hypothetical protein
MIHSTLKELLNLDAKDAAMVAGCATLTGAICSIGVQWVAPWVDKNSAIFLFGSLGGLVGLVALAYWRRNR